MSLYILVGIYLLIMSDYEEYQAYQTSNQLGALFFLIILIIALPFLIRFIDPTFGEYQANKSIGLNVISVVYPSVAPIYSATGSHSFPVIFTVANNNLGVPASFELCLENTGLFTLEGSACQSGQLANGQSTTVTFYLTPPNYTQYLNIPYTQQMLWILVYQYSTSSDSEVYFVSQNMLTNRNISGVAGTISSSAGPLVPVLIPLNEPAPYGADLGIEVALDNRGNGYPLFTGSVGSYTGGVSLQISTSPGLEVSNVPSQISQPTSTIYFSATASGSGENITEYWINITASYVYLNYGTISITLPHIYVAS
jgi:hypothetical protein